MPDFAKALKQLEGRRSFSLAQQLRFLRPLSRTRATLLPPGEIHSNMLGSYYRIEAIYPDDYFHGKVRLGRFSSSDLGYLLQLMREKARVPDRDRIVFLDTETTGIQGGTGM